MNSASEPQYSNKVYFPNLNGLRFIAAFMVVIHHLEQILYIFNKPNHWGKGTILIVGKLGVTLFFVLSGFLITYLLLAEEKSSKTINIKNFYVRQILRIWPLYYTVILASFFIFPNIRRFAMPEAMEPINLNFGYYLFLFLLFLPNLVLFGYGIALPYGAQSWSVGVEEQFYLIWPLLMKLIKSKLILFLGIITGYFFIWHLGFKIVRYIFGWNDVLESFRGFYHFFEIYSMATGGLFAYIAFGNYVKIKQVMQHPLVWISTIITTIVLIGFAIQLHHLVYSILFGLIIYNLACNDKLKQTF